MACHTVTLSHCLLSRCEFSSAKNHWVLCLQTESNTLRILSSLENTTLEDTEYSCRSSEDCLLLSGQNEPSIPFSFQCKAGLCVAVTRWRQLEVKGEEDVGSSLVPEEWEADSGIPRCGHQHHHPLTLTFQRSPRFWR